MNAIAAITNDHEEIRGLVARIVELDQDAEYLIAQLRLRLAAHSAATETQVYREMLEHDPTSAELVGTRAEHHHDLETQLTDVERNIGTEELSRSVAALRETIATELDREESTVLPRLKQLFSGERLAEMGRRYELRWLAEMDVRARPEDGTTEPTA